MQLYISSSKTDSLVQVLDYSYDKLIRVRCHRLGYCIGLCPDIEWLRLHFVLAYCCAIQKLVGCS